MMKTMDIKLLREHLEYRDGKLYWIKGIPGRSAGKRAGSRAAQGYRQIAVLGQKMREHRVIWALIHGEWPIDHLDHINRIRDDNRIENLRLATPLQNQGNKGMSKNNTSGFKGVTWHKGRKKWQVALSDGNKCKYIGLFDHPFPAALAYDKAARELHGEFASTNYRLGGI